MDKEEINERVKELTLMLLYLTSWDENELGMKYRRSCKGYDAYGKDYYGNIMVYRNQHKCCIHLSLGLRS